MNTARIETLPCWQGSVAIEPLGGGITNRNFLVTDGPNRYVARVCADRSLLGIDRDNERACQAAAATLGIAPEVHYAEAGILVSPFVSGRVLVATDLRDRALVARMAATLRQLHDGWDQALGEFLYFCPFATARTYAARARARGANLPADLDTWLADTRAVQGRMAPFRPKLCHNDLLPANLIDSGERIWLIDWEYGGVGHPFFDLAGFAGNGGLDSDEAAVLLEMYLGRAPSAAEWFDFRALKAASLLRESLWAALQAVASDLNFDYPAYAAENLARYEQARAELD